MGSVTYVEGGFEIHPPLEWTEFKGSRFYGGNRHDSDVVLKVAEEFTDTPEGELIKRRATHLVMREIDEYNDRNLIEELQEAVNAFPGHTWVGCMECRSVDYGDTWRIEIQGRFVQRVDPMVMWPGEETHGEKAVRVLHQRIQAADGGEYCDLCSNHGDIHWPCATIQALEGRL